MILNGFLLPYGRGKTGNGGFQNHVAIGHLTCIKLEEEKIGNPDLLVGRDREFENFGRWIANIPKKLSKSRVILARRKSGKTSFVQRIFNRLWSENGEVIPFYIDIPESKIWYPHLAIKYYRVFASQYISFLERDESPIDRPLSLERGRINSK